MNDDLVLADTPVPRVRRLTLNRPEKHNALNDGLRSALFGELREADADGDVSVIVIRGAGPSFCSGYDLAKASTPVERASSQLDGWWPRHVVNNWFEMWDMAGAKLVAMYGFGMDEHDDGPSSPSCPRDAGTHRCDRSPVLACGTRRDRRRPRLRKLVVGTTRPARRRVLRRCR